MKENKCQCCLTNIAFSDKNTDYIFVQKNYSELIKETFNLSVSKLFYKGLYHRNVYSYKNNYFEIY